MANRILTGIVVALAICIGSACDSARENCKRRVDLDWGDICQDFVVVGAPAYGSASTRPMGDVLLLACLDSVLRKKKCDSESDIPDSAGTVFRGKKNANPCA
jgi:hypothetical protein